MNKKNGFGLTNQQVRWFIALGILGFLWYIAPGYGRQLNFFNMFDGNSGYAYEEYDDYDEDDYNYESYAIENIHLIDNWTEDIYRSIEIATEAWDEDYSEVEYLDGDNYDDLVSEVGRPESTYRYDDGYGNKKITATWSVYTDNDEYVSVDVTYLADSKMITDKYCFGYDE